MQRILILRFSSLGDVVLASTLLDAIRSQWPQAEIWWVTKRAFASLYEEDPRVARVVSYDRAGGLDAVVRALDPHSFDLVLDAHSSLRSRLLCLRLAPAPVRRIQKDAVARWLFAHGRVRSRALRRRQVDRYRDLVGESTVAWRPRVVPSPRQIEAARALDLDLDGALLLAPGARHATKRWDPARFAEVGQGLRERTGDPVVVVGSAAEEPLCREVAKAIPGAGLLTGIDDLGVLGAALARGRVLLCNDSGLLHLAEAVGTPVLALFGPTSREFGFFPLDPRSRVVEHALPCRPCSRTGDRPCRMPETWCLTRSTPSLVLSQLEVLWQRVPAMST